ncbi:hypothetical protein PILCRDRAFT_818057 [Piloderma croceum F 1598]|uniref:Uncharacterized protein n=1 Tax=Piloderma croceum (strain F 1598) TaxID=765440 RepID=A0A0C3G184_PILCF|nr:hypothetical protein PILCRDRAFT_818057 [Piloderma croceum F 1598]
MQVASNHHSYRGVQRSPRPGTTTYMQGKKQTALAIQKYHILCAALQNKYVIRDITPIEPIEPIKPTPNKHRKLKPMTYRSTLWFSV